MLLFVRIMREPSFQYDSYWQCGALWGASDVNFGDFVVLMLLLFRSVIAVMVQ